MLFFLKIELLIEETSFKMIKNTNYSKPLTASVNKHLLSCLTMKLVISDAWLGMLMVERSVNTLFWYIGITV